MGQDSLFDLGATFEEAEEEQPQVRSERKAKPPKAQYSLFALGHDGDVSESETKSANFNVEHPRGRWEQWYTEHWVDAMVAALTQPVRIFGPFSRDLHHSPAGRKVDIILERLLRLMKISNRHRDRLDALQMDGGGDADFEDAYRELGHDWKKPALTLTNWETCMAMMETSLEGPLSRAGYEEYKRAFAHCFGLDAYKKCFDEEPLRLEDCKLARWQQPSKHRLPDLDEYEVRWIADFNQALKGNGHKLAEELFRAEVQVEVY